MAGVLLLLGGLGATTYYLQTLEPPVEITRKGQFEGRTIEGGRDITNTEQGNDFMTTVGVTPDIDAQTGLPFVWIHKANGTRSQSFTDAYGSQIGRPQVNQA
jgi:hypothetical protein